MLRNQSCGRIFFLTGSNKLDETRPKYHEGEIFLRKRPLMMRKPRLESRPDMTGGHAIVARISAISFSVVSGLIKQNRETVSEPSEFRRFVGATSAKPDS